MDSASRRIGPVIRLLRERYPQPRTALEFQNPLQILVATILAAQCTDERVNRITPGLFRKYPTAAAFARADRSELEQEIRSAGISGTKPRTSSARPVASSKNTVVPSRIPWPRS